MEDNPSGLVVQGRSKKADKEWSLYFPTVRLDFSTKIDSEFRAFTGCPLGGTENLV